MKSINVLSLLQAYNSLGEHAYASFLEHYGIEIKDKEVDDLASLAENILCESDEKSVLNDFYISYKIPQIGKEFDLLRFGESSVINIELKSDSTEDKIKKQLIRNKYYLEYLDKQVYCLTYVSSKKTLYRLNSTGELKSTSFDYLNRILERQRVEALSDIDKLFNPSNYLVSPFNSTDKFLQGKYFLTSQQEDIKKKVLKDIDGANCGNFVSIQGSAGTGKTLLVYDIVKGLKVHAKPLIIHCGVLNRGQVALNMNGWDIRPIRELRIINLPDYDAIFIDEAQRIYPRQLKEIIAEVDRLGVTCVFSYDKVQTLSATEEKYDIDAEINKIGALKTYKLSEKIRTNKEISNFIKALFNSKRNYEIEQSDNITFNYFEYVADAKDYTSTLNHEEWKVIRFTPSQYDREHHQLYSIVDFETSHGVIGQEFDGVAVVLDKFFSYRSDGKLHYQGAAYYDPTKMLFQNMTRTRKKLNLVIINNAAILHRCISVLRG